MNRSAAEILREYGPFPGVDQVAGVTFDGQHVWFASGDRLNALDPASGKTVRAIDVAAHAGTAFDGRHLFQLAEDRIQKIDPETGRVLATIPAPGGGDPGGMAWAEGSLWVGQYRDRKIHQIDPRPGRSSAPSRPAASSPGSPGSMASSGTAPGKVTRRCAADRSADGREFWSGSRCRPAWACRGSSPMAVTRFYCSGGNSGKVRSAPAAVKWSHAPRALSARMGSSRATRIVLSRFSNELEHVLIAKVSQLLRGTCPRLRREAAMAGLWCASLCFSNERLAAAAGRRPCRAARLPSYLLPAQRWMASPRSPRSWSSSPA